MATEYWLLLLIIAVGLTMFIARYLAQKAGETAEIITWSNYRQPLIFEQPNYGDAAALATVQAYENALTKLKEHGNTYLTKNDVHLWIHKSDAENTGIDFEQWAFYNVTRRQRVFSDFYTAKSKAAKAAGKEIEAAHFIAKAQFAPVEFETEKDN